MTRILRCLAALALLAVACSTPEERLARHIERGQEHLAEDEPDAALLEFRSALKIHPDDPAVYEQIADILFERSALYVEALRYYQEAYRLDPKRIHSAMRAARVLAHTEPKAAAELIGHGLAEAPELPVVHRALSELALVQGQLPAARKAAEQAVALDPSQAESWTQLGLAHLARIARRQKLGLPPLPADYAEAAATLEKADALMGGTDPRARLEIAHVYGLWGRRSKASHVYREAMQLAQEQDSLAAIRFTATAIDEYARHIRDLELQRFALRAWVDADEDAYEAWERLGAVAEQLPNESGEEVYMELLRRRPKDPRAHMLYAAYLAQAGREHEAAAHLQHSLDRGIEDPEIGEALVRLAIRKGAYAEARAAYAQLAENHEGAYATRVAEARLALAEGRAADAARVLEGLVAENEQHEVLRLLALAHLRQGQLGPARRAVERAVELAPPPGFAALRARARVAETQEDWDQAARDYFTLAVSGQPLSDEEGVRFAESLYHTGRADLGRKGLLDLVSKDPPDPAAALAYAEIEGANDPEGAHRYLLAAHQSALNNPRVLLALTRLERERGQSEQALARLDELVEQRVAGPEMLLLRAELLAEAGDYDRAEADLLRAFEADPGLPGAMDLLYSVYREQGRLEEARRSFEQADEAGVLHSGARLLLARFYLGAGDLALARTALERVVEERPDLWPAKSDLALALAEQGEQLERAQALAEEARTASGDAPASVDRLGYVHLKAGRPAEALQEFERAIEQAQRRAESIPPTFEYHRGLALRALGRDEDAARAFQTALGQGEFPEAEDARRQLEAAGQPEHDSQPGSDQPSDQPRSEARASGMRTPQPPARDRSAAS